MMIANLIESEQITINNTNFGRSAFHDIDEEPDLQDLYENNNYYKALDPEDFTVDRGWWYRCRDCGVQTRIFTKNPSCLNCGFSQKLNRKTHTNSKEKSC